MEIYLTDLAAYNSGHLVGEWVALPCDNLDERLQAILKQGASIVGDGVHEEWFITDYEAPFSVHEYDDIYLLNDKAATMANLSEQELKKIKFLESQGEDFSRALELLNEVSLYEGMSFEDLAWELIEETWDVPEHLLNYIDAEKFARELEMDYTEIDGDLFYNYY